MTVTVRCPNHHQKLTSGLWNLLQIGQGMDSELRCGKRSVMAHAMMLQVFLSKDQLAPVPETTEVADTLTPPFDVLLTFVLEFLYRGTVTLKEEQLDDLHAIAKQLHFQLLVDAVDETKLCKPVKIAITRVNEVTITSPDVNRNRTKQKSRRNISRSRESGTKKLKMSCTSTDQGLGRVSDQFDTSKCQPEALEIQPASVTPVKPKSRRTTTARKRKASTASTRAHPHTEQPVWKQLVHKCDGCKFEASSGALLAVHQAGEHDPSLLVYRCSKCPIKFATDTGILEHIEEFHPGTDSLMSSNVHDRDASPLQCRFRDRRFVTGETRTEQLANQRMLRCSVCDFETASRAVLNHHLNNVHYVDVKGKPLSVLRCSDCDYVTLIPACFGRHRRLKHFGLKVSSYKPAIVTKRTRKPRTKFSYRKNHSCSHCDYKSPNRCSLIFHVAKMHDSSIPVFKCNICYRKFVNEVRLKLHTDVAHASGFSCPHCDFKTMLKFSFQLHLSKHGPTEDALFRCKVCTRSFKSPEILEDHLKNHEMISCSSCEYTTKSRTCLRRHNLRKHSSTIASELQCTKCSKSCETKEELEEHLTSHKVLKCPFCDYSTKTKSCLWQHKLVKHPDEKSTELRCTKCSNLFKTAEELKEHLTNHKILKCILCDYVTKNRSSLWRHKTVKHPVSKDDPESFRCKFCARYCKSSDALDEHLANHKILKCNLCDFTTKYRKSFSNHGISKHNLSRPKKMGSEQAHAHRCIPCRKNFKSEEELQNHVTNHEPLQCPLCEYTSMNKGSFWSHKILKHPNLQRLDGIERHTCSLCTRRFKSFEDLEKHVADHPIYRCSLCDFETKKKTQCDAHRVIAHSVYASGKPMPIFSCPECKFTSNRASVLKTHKMAVHTTLKPFKCPYCSYATARKVEVNRHISKIHLNMKPHVCTVCGYRAYYNSMLVEHMITHTGEKPFKCDTCDAAFSSRRGLREHKRDHSEQPRPHVCHLCGRTFKRGNHLNTHMKGVHKNKV